MRVMLYARVSTRDKEQNPENQLTRLRREAARASDTVIRKYVDEESGGKASRKKCQFLLRDAQQRRFELGRFFALDRFSSQGIEGVFEYTTALDRAERTLGPPVNRCATQLAP